MLAISVDYYYVHYNKTGLRSLLLQKPPL